MTAAWDQLVFVLEESPGSTAGLSNPMPDRVWGHGKGVVMVAVDGIVHEPIKPPVLSTAPHILTHIAG